MKIVTMMLTFILLGGVQTTFAQITNVSGEDQNANQEMVTDAWERDWDNMDDKQRKEFTEEWNYTSEADRQQKMQERQMKRQQELNDMATIERDEYTQNLQDRKDKWQNMSPNEREQFGQRVLDYYSGDSVHQYYSRH